MKPAALLPLAVMLTVAGADARAQGGSDLMVKLQACSQLEEAARRDCLDKLSREIAPPSVAATPAPTPAAPTAPAAPPTPQASPPAAPAADNWVVSETTSPLDYSPIATATATATGPTGAIMSLTIQCRAGRSDILVSGPALQGGPIDIAVGYAINGGPPIQVLAGAAPSGTGLALRVDTARLITSLPDDGEIAIRVGGRQAVEGRFALAGLKGVRTRIAATCKWPPVAGAPRN
ncbi:MAG TPA: hypothetical protein VJ890_07120 [Vineibacter sp.]|nr:hypothetical protein [Vineibacter sp.]